MDPISVRPKKSPSFVGSSLSYRWFDTHSLVTTNSCNWALFVSWLIFVRSKWHNVHMKTMNISQIVSRRDFQVKWVFQCSLISSSSCSTSEKQNHWHSICSSDVVTNCLSSTKSLKKLIHHAALLLLYWAHQDSILWLWGEGTYVWLFSSSLKKVCAAAIIPSSVPRSLIKSTQHPLSSSTASGSK